MASSPLPPDADRAFAEFFRGQVPNPWPACPVPASAKPVPASEGAWGSRFALAASVALLLGLGFAFTGGLASNAKLPAGGNLMNGATADGKGLLKHADPMKDFPMMP